MHDSDNGSGDHAPHGRPSDRGRRRWRAGAVMRTRGQRGVLVRLVEPSHDPMSSRGQLGGSLRTAVKSTST
jgi:hypothetical protein